MIHFFQSNTLLERWPLNDNITFRSFTRPSKFITNVFYNFRLFTTLIGRWNLIIQWMKTSDFWKWVGRRPFFNRNCLFKLSLEKSPVMTVLVFFLFSSLVHNIETKIKFVTSDNHFKLKSWQGQTIIQLLNIHKHVHLQMLTNLWGFSLSWFAFYQQIQYTCNLFI